MGQVMFIVAALVVTLIGYVFISSYIMDIYDKDTRAIYLASSPFIGIIVSLIIAVVLAVIGTILLISLLSGVILWILDFFAAMVACTFELRTKTTNNVVFNWAVTHCKARAEMVRHPYINSLGPIYIRNPLCHPDDNWWRYGTWHPFMTRRAETYSS